MRNKYFLLIILILALLGAFCWREIYYPKEPGSDKTQVFVIEKGEGLRSISSNLKKYGLIKSKILFELYALLGNSVRNLQAGVYNLSPSMNIPQILTKFTSGDTIKEKITILEGWSLKEIGKYFKEKGIIKQEKEFFEIVGAPGKVGTQSQLVEKLSEEFDFLKEKPKNVSLEGYLFPDTYEIEPKEDLQKIVRKMLKNFDQKITEDLKKEIASQGKTLFQVLTMASLLEKEVKSYEDRQIVAGILWKRLRSGWPLQVDATLTYLTGRDSLELTKKDKEIDSPYNTYKYYGLPLGPICNPGLESIKAAVYYKESPYWFYLTTPEGRTIFSKTLKEHNYNRFKYLYGR